MDFILYKNDGVRLREVSSEGDHGLRLLKNFSKKPVPCLCGKKNSIMIARKDRYAIPSDFKLCKSCGLVRIDPYYKNEDLEIIYEQLYRNIKDKTETQTFNYQIEKGKKIVKFLERRKILNEISTVLEIGTGAGGILFVFKERGLDVCGVDFDPRYIEYGRTKGLNLVVGDGIAFLNKQYAKKFNLIILNHVIEHVKDPRKMIIDILASMPENCYLYVAFPGLLKFANEESSNRLSKCFAFVHPWWFDLNSFFVNILNGLQVNVVYADEGIRLLLKKSNETFNWKNKSRYKRIIINFLYLKLREKIFQ